jgi:hypothetical protein
LASKGGSAKVKQQIPQLSHGLFEGVFIRHLDKGYAINLTSESVVSTHSQQNIILLPIKIVDSVIFPTT